MKNYKNPYIHLVAMSWHYAAGHRKEFVLFYSMSAIANFVLLTLPIVLGKIFDTLQAGGPTLMHDLTIWMIAYGGVTCGYWLFHGPARNIESRLAYKIKQAFVDRMYQLIMALPVAWHEEHHSGETTNRVEKAADALQEFSETQFNYIMYIITFIVPLVALAIASPLVALMAALATWLAVVVIWNYDKKLVPLLEQENHHEHHLSSVLSDYVGSMITVRSLRIVERTRTELVRVMQTAVPIIHKAISLNEMKWFMLALCRVIIEGVILYLYIIIVGKDNPAAIIGSSIMVYQYLRRLSDTSVGFADSYEKIIRWRTICESVKHIEDAHAQMPAEPEINAIQSWNHIHVGSIDFFHEDPIEQKPIHTLKNVSIDIKRGERIALVGASGAGKSTLLGLLRGIYQAKDGYIRVNDAMPESLFTLSQLTTLIPQDPEIFANTIRYNITTGMPHDDMVLNHAINTACFETVLQRLPNQLETDIREKGINLSGGEKQRLALARGVFMASGSSILLLDEPTSSVDSATERHVYQRLFTAFPDAAIISSIHRLNLLELFDRVYVMDGGRVVEQGSFAELLKQDGLLASMWQHYHAKKEQ